jgi:hypothetical protein
LVAAAEYYLEPESPKEMVMVVGTGSAGVAHHPLCEDQLAFRSCYTELCRQLWLARLGSRLLEPVNVVGHAQLQTLLGVSVG